MTGLRGTLRFRQAAAGKNTERISIINEIYPHFVEIVEEIYEM
jgi:DNA modification methylase